MAIVAASASIGRPVWPRLARVMTASVMVPTAPAVSAWTALLAGTVTAFCGPIGFIGTAVPHLCRAIFNTSDHRVLTPATALGGAFLGLISALIAELPGTDATLPLNAVTALFGAPVVIWVILRQRNMQKAFGG